MFHEWKFWKKGRDKNQFQKTTALETLVHAIGVSPTLGGAERESKLS